MLQTFYLGTKFATRRCIEVPGAPTCFGNWVDSVNGVDQWEKFKKKYIHCNPQQCPSNVILIDICLFIYVNVKISNFNFFQLIRNTFHGPVGLVVPQLVVLE